VTDAYPDRLSQRRFRDPYADTTFGWYGVDPVFRVLVERNVNNVVGFEPPFRRIVEDDRLRYEFRGLEVTGDLERHDLTIDFTRGPLGLWAMGIAPCDYPSVSTNVERQRKHIHGDGSLCLWAAFDPPHRRWWHGDGLQAIVEIARRHLFYELHWWRTGGPETGEWVGDEAPHGIPQGARLP
jgi:hypothetical protein